MNLLKTSLCNGLRYEHLNATMRTKLARLKADQVPMAAIFN